MAWKQFAMSCAKITCAKIIRGFQVNSLIEQNAPRGDRSYFFTLEGKSNGQMNFS